MVMAPFPEKMTSMFFMYLYLKINSDQNPEEVFIHYLDQHFQEFS